MHGIIAQEGGKLSLFKPRNRLNRRIIQHHFDWRRSFQQVLCKFVIKFELILVTQILEAVVDFEKDAARLKATVYFGRELEESSPQT